MDYLSAYFIVIYVVIGVYILWCFMLIARKAGYTTIFGILMIIPVINLILLGVFTFEKWPITKLYIKQQHRLIDMMKLEGTTVCNKCGKTVDIQDKYCSECGNELELQ